MLTVILPARNEVEAIGKVLDELGNFEVIVVDSNSTNGTREEVLKRGIPIMNEDRRGKGNAVRKAIPHILTEKVVMIDSDYTYPTEYIPMIDGLLDEVDVVICYRKWKEKGSMSFLNSFGNYFLSKLASLLYGYKVYDVCSGMWGFRTEKLQRFNPTSGGFTLEADLFVNSVRNGCKISQIPIEYRRRLGGSEPKLKLGDGFKIAWFLIKSKRRRSL